MLQQQQRNMKVYLLHDGRMAFHRRLTMDGDDDDDDDSSTDDNSNNNIIENNVDKEQDDFTYERPDRILCIYKRLMALQKQLLLQHSTSSSSGWCDSDTTRFIKIECIPAHRKSIELVHTREMYNELYATQFMSDGELIQLTNSKIDLYYNRYTFQAASLAAGGVIQCVDHVTSQYCETTRAIALVRPPGHHAVQNEPMGKFLFLFFGQ